MEYDYWMDKTATTRHTFKLPDGSVLNRYYDQWDVPRAESYNDDVEAAKGATNPKDLYRQLRSAAESGWDFSSRWFADGQNNKKSRNRIQTTDLLPVDLNCLLHHLETTLAKAYELSGNPPKRIEFEQLAAKRKNAINRFCWSADKKWYVDYNTMTGKVSPELTLAGMAPLFFQIAPKDHVADISRRVRAEFLKPGGVVTTLKEIPPGAEGEQWDFPNGWPPLQWITIKGLENYGEQALAQDIAKRWIALNVKVFKETGRLMEKYNVVDLDAKAGGGEYKSQEGFGWTNGVLLKLISMYGMP
jgi:alpha,alpha-trehalase